MGVTIQDICNQINAAAAFLKEAQRAEATQNDWARKQAQLNAGEAMSMALEWGLNYIQEVKTKKPFPDDVYTIANKINHVCNTVFQGLLVDSDLYKYLVNKKIKDKVNNAGKHAGEELDFDLQLQYLSNIKIFLQAYIPETNNFHLYTVEELSDQSDDFIYYAADRFDKNLTDYILIVDKIDTSGYPNIEYLMDIPWTLIIDLDRNDRKKGTFSDLAIEQRKFVSEILVPMKTPYSLSPHISKPYYFFAKGYDGDQYDRPVETYADWRDNMRSGLKRFIAQYAQLFNRDQVIVFINLSIENKPFMTKIMDDIKESYINLSHRIDCKLIYTYADSDEKLFRTIDEWSHENNIKTNRFTSKMFIKSVKGIVESKGIIKSREGLDYYQLPYNTETMTEGINGQLTNSEFHDFSMDFEVLFEGIDSMEDLDESTIYQQRTSFLKGETLIPWYGFRTRPSFDFYIERDCIQSFEMVRKHLNKSGGNRSGGILNLYHEPGIGGTTLSRRIAWYFHGTYPVVLLKAYRPVHTLDSAVKIFNKTKLPILIIAEVPRVCSESDIDNFWSGLKASTSPFLLLLVRRITDSNRIQSENSIPPPNWARNIEYLISDYKKHIPDNLPAERKREKDRLYRELSESQEIASKNPFNVGLITFEEDYVGLSSYIKGFCNRLEFEGNEDLRNAIVYASIINIYTSLPVPSVLLNIWLSLEGGKSLEYYFKSHQDIYPHLIVTDGANQKNYWRIRHVLIAKELVKQLITTSHGNESLKHTLPAPCKEMIYRSSDLYQNKDALAILKELFIGDRSKRAHDERFAPIFTDSLHKDHWESIWIALCDSFSIEPHFFAHTARYYAFVSRDYSKAVKYANIAIEMDSSDSSIHHIKGVCLRKQLYSMLSTVENNVRRGKSNFSNSEIADITVLFDEAAKCFTDSREIQLSKGDRIDGYGHISHVEMILHTINFLYTVKSIRSERGNEMKQEKIDFIAQLGSPYNEWLDTAECLLDEVSRIKTDDEYVGNVMNDLAGLYDNYEKLIIDLNNKLQVLRGGANVNSIRRRLVRAYLSRQKGKNGKPGKPIGRQQLPTLIRIAKEAIENESSNRNNYILWLELALLEGSKVPLSEAIEIVSLWKSKDQKSIEPAFYYYVLKFIKGFEGSLTDANESRALLNDCSIRARHSDGRIKDRFFLGSGAGLASLLIPENIDKSELARIDGFLTSFENVGNATVTIVIRNTYFNVFISPSQLPSHFRISKRDEHKPVSLNISFSYDGLRGHNVRLKD